MVRALPVDLSDMTQLVYEWFSFLLGTPCRIGINENLALPRGDTYTNMHFTLCKTG